MFYLFLKKAGIHQLNSFLYSISNDDHPKKKVIPFFVILLIAHSLTLSFDSLTGTLTITNDSDFTNTYRKLAEHVIIAEGVTSILYKAFWRWPYFTSVIISDTVISIGEYAFSSCHSLGNITIPDSIIIINGYAFESCTVLTTVTLGSRVETIGRTLICSSFREERKSWIHMVPPICPFDFIKTFGKISKRNKGDFAGICFEVNIKEV